MSVLARPHFRSHLVSSEFAPGLAKGYRLCVTSIASYCVPVPSASYAYIFASSGAKASKTLKCSLCVDGGVGLFATLGCFTGVDRSSVGMIDSIVGGRFGATTISHMSRQ